MHFFQCDQIHSFYKNSNVVSIWDSFEIFNIYVKMNWAVF